MAVDSDTERAVRAFSEGISDRYPVIGARLYGSRARADHALDSDADVAVLLKGPRRDPLAVGVEMAGVAFLLDTDIWVSPLPIWEDDWRHPETFSNPHLLENIRRDGIEL